jgi:general nucleoside transport system permease protein
LKSLPFESPNSKAQFPFYRIGGMLSALLSLLPTLAVGGGCCIFLALLSGVEPFAIIVTIWKGAWGSEDSAAAALSKVTPLLLTGLAVALAYQANLLNIGCEGQMTLGALSAASFAVAASSLPPLLLMPLTLLVGALAGGLWALPAVWLRQKRGVHEVISTLLLNYLAIYLAEYLVLGPLGDGTVMGRTPELTSGAALSPLIPLGAQGITAAPIMALVLSIGAQIWLSRTVWGYEVRATGSNIIAARAAGIAAGRWQRRMFLLSGALAGLAGALEVLAVHHRFYRAFSPGYGFDGITAAFLVKTVPGWLWLSSLLLASLRAADKWLQLLAGISPNTILVIQAVLLLSVACQWKLPAKWRKGGSA